jgi:hypothetical protein
MFYLIEHSGREDLSSIKDGYSSRNARSLFRDLSIVLFNSVGELLAGSFVDRLASRGHARLAVFPNSYNNKIMIM